MIRGDGSKATRRGRSDVIGGEVTTDEDRRRSAYNDPHHDADHETCVSPAKRLNIRVPRQIVLRGLLICRRFIHRGHLLER